VADAYTDARMAFAAWRERFPTDPYRADRHLDLANRRYLPEDRLDEVRADASAFGEIVSAELGALVASYAEHPPLLQAYDGLGNRTEEVRFDPAYHEAGSLVWASGLVRDSVHAGGSFEQATKFYLASLEGELGHLCAVTCTTGMVRVLRRSGSDGVKERWLPALAEVDYSQATRGAQFLTEIQGGSDVGAIATEAVALGDGSFRVTGEKWFCSVADAGAFLVLARPEGAGPGTAGLGCFLIPRLVGGAPNGFSIRRLKTKLGTTSMASGEIDFDNALAFPVGEVDAGFKIMVTGMLNTSRWLNAVGTVGIMRRAYLDASGYATYREAFGRRIADFPLVRRQLAMIKAAWLAGLHSTWELTALDEMVDLAAMGAAPIDADSAGFHRYLVNANKLVCSLAATEAVREAIEILGGNGVIETFSILPRLLRDSIVFEQWEGTHNVLTAQVLRDLDRLDLTGTVLDRSISLLKGIADPDLAETAARATVAVEELGAAIRVSLDDPAHGSLHFREHLEGLVRAHQVALLLDAAAAEQGAEVDELAAAAALLTGRHLDRGYRPEHDPNFLPLIDQLLGDDLE
jgi:alkylation response protein AidB-like acyl-CoA dehydrogenase